MRILKFDILYPNDYFLKKQEENKELISNLSFEGYVEWIHSLKIGYGDIITEELKKAGCEVQDYYNQDEVFLHKLKKKYHFNPGFLHNIFSKDIKFLKQFSLKKLLQSRKNQQVRSELQKNVIVRKYIDEYKPDIIFLREPCQVDNAIFREIKNDYLVATLIGCNITHPINWQAQTSDVIFTLIPEYKTFFEINKIETYLFEYGISEAMYEELKGLPKIHDVVFVGLLGTDDQSQKSRLMEFIASHFNFKWWGPMGELINDYPNLEKAWQGMAAGKDMFTIYHQAKIVLNDYVDTANHKAVNMRIKEVLSTGSLLLTRQAENITLLREQEAIETFENEEDCKTKLEYLLANGEQREAIAMKGLSIAKELYRSSDIISRMKETLEKSYKNKFSKTKRCINES